MDRRSPHCRGEHRGAGLIQRLHLRLCARTGSRAVRRPHGLPRLGVEGLLDPPGDWPDPSEVEIPVGFGELGQVGPWQIVHPSGTTVTESVGAGTWLRSTTYFPYGLNASPASLKWATPNGMPMIVMQSRTPTMKMAKSEQQTKEDEPDDIADRRPGTRPRLSHHCSPKGPKTKSSHPEGRHHQRDGDDQDYGEEPGDHIPNRHLQPAENQPEDVPDDPHSAATLANSLAVLARRRQTADGRRQTAYHLVPDRSSARAQTPASRAYAPPWATSSAGDPRSTIRPSSTTTT